MRIAREAQVLKAGGVVSFFARLSSACKWMGIGGLVIVGMGGEVVRGVGAKMFLPVGSSDRSCNVSSARAYRSRGFDVTVTVFKGMDAVTQTSVWPVTVVVEYPTKELQKLRRLFWPLLGSLS